jgi:hypothetical protein
VVASEIRKVMPPPGAFGGPGQAVQVAYVQPAEARPVSSGKGLVVFEIPQPAKKIPDTPYLGSLNWINGE